MPDEPTGPGGGVNLGTGGVADEGAESDDSGTDDSDFPGPGDGGGGGGGGGSDDDEPTGPGGGVNLGTGGVEDEGAASDPQTDRDGDSNGGGGGDGGDGDGEPTGPGGGVDLGPPGPDDTFDDPGGDDEPTGPGGGVNLGPGLDDQVQEEAAASDPQTDRLPPRGEPTGPGGGVNLGIGGVADEGIDQRPEPGRAVDVGTGEGSILPGTFRDIQRRTDEQIRREDLRLVSGELRFSREFRREQAAEGTPFGPSDIIIGGSGPRPTVDAQREFQRARRRGMIRGARLRSGGEPTGPGGGVDLGPPGPEGIFDDPVDDVPTSLSEAGDWTPGGDTGGDVGTIGGQDAEALAEHFGPGADDLPDWAVEGAQGEGTDVVREAATGPTPRTHMTLDQEGLQARAAREEVFAERAESGFEKLLDLDLSDRTLAEAGLVAFGDLDSSLSDDLIENVPTRAEGGAAMFQTGEIVERTFAETGGALGTVGPESGPGRVPGFLAETTFGTAGAVLSAPLQLPATAQATVDRDAVTETRELESPAEELVGVGEVPEGTDPDVVASAVAERNPGVSPGDLDVTRDDGDFDIEADLTERQQRERIAAVNPGADPSDIWFTEAGDPMLTEVTGDGQTPTEVSGGTVGSGVETAESQIRLAQEEPWGTAALFALPAAQTAGRFRRGFREGSRSSEVVRAEDLTTAEGVEGEIPVSESFRDASTREAVREIETRAAEQPEVVQEAVGAEQTMFHTTGERIGEPIVQAEGATSISNLATGQRFQGQRALEVAEGASEAPGMFVSPELNPVGLRSTPISGRSSPSLTEYLRPSRPDLGGRTDRVAAFEGDRVAGMPERAGEFGYEVRGPGGERLEGGLGRGEAKSRAADIEGAEVGPDVTTSAYEYLTQEAQPGTAQVRPSGARSSEIEAIMPPESQFVQQTGGPRVDVQFGGRVIDVPFTDVQLSLGGERVPMDAFRRAGEQPSRTGESTVGRLTAEEIADTRLTPTEASRVASGRAGPVGPTSAGTAGGSSLLEPTTPAPTTTALESTLSPTSPVSTTTTGPTATETAPTSTSPTTTTTSPTTSAPTSTGTTTTTTTGTPTDVPTRIPTDVPTRVPTDVPTRVPSDVPTRIPTDVPTGRPWEFDERREDEIDIEEPEFDDFLEEHEYGVATPEEIASGEVGVRMDETDDVGL